MRYLSLAFGVLVLACGGEAPSERRDAGPLPRVDAFVPRRDAGPPPPMLDAGPLPDGAVTTVDAGGGGFDAGPPQPCEDPGTIEELPCGACGTVSRFCTSGGVWEYGLCEDETGECTPGTTRDGACDRCGTQPERCTAACEWESFGDCEDMGVCDPGELVRSADGCASGERDFRCSDACVLEPVGECATDACDTPGAEEESPCGNCGTRTRFCTLDHEWQYFACEDEGVCVAGTTRTSECGDCGEQMERCNASCEWTASGGCTDEGECAPGAMSTTTMGCSGGAQRPVTCSDECAFEISGACQAAEGELGDPCTPGSCMDDLECSDGTGVSICRQPCTDSSMCTATSWCFTGDMVCSDACTYWTDAGCPSGAKCDYMGSTDDFGLTSIFVCSGVGTGAHGASCTANSQCRRGHTCLTDAFGIGTCTRVCDSSHPCAGGVACPLGSPFPISTYNYCP